ncbi:hypothetical protein [Streptomyces phaeofaciens]|uniref:hypothetical protein n=1 Tax=Streptomyces phaeofaciens TaxID=68254 RepID=UPI0036974515
MNMGADARGRAVLQQAGGNLSDNSHSSSVVNNIRIASWTGLVSMFAAAVGGVGLYTLLSDESGKPGNPTSQGTAVTDPRADRDSSGGATASDGSNSRDTQSPPDTDPAEQWRGTLVLDSSGGKELDGERPTTVTSFLVGGDISLGLLDSGYQVMAGSGGAVAQWKGVGKSPDHASCAESLDTTGSDFAPAAPDTMLCVRTNGGRIARLQVTEFSEGFQLGVRFDAVIWELSADAAAAG